MGSAKKSDLSQSYMHLSEYLGGWDQSTLSSLLWHSVDLKAATGYAENN